MFDRGRVKVGSCTPAISSRTYIRVVTVVVVVVVAVMVAVVVVVAVAVLVRVTDILPPCSRTGTVRERPASPVQNKRSCYAPHSIIQLRIQIRRASITK